jgi:hypothetical protein
MPLEREDLEGYVNILRQDIDRVEKGINSRLDTLNSKTNINSIDIAVLKALTENHKTTARNHGAGWGGAMGTFVGAIIAVLYQIFSN